MNVDLDFAVRSIIGMLVITAAFDPIKILYFNQAIVDSPRDRIGAAAKVSLYVLVILGGTALVGRRFLELIGVNLHAFSAVGGLIIALMGFEMLYGGGASQAQGERVRERKPEDEDTLMIPLTIPLIAGPGAIATTITIAAQDDSGGPLVIALVGSVVVAASAFLSYAFLGGLLARARPSLTMLLARLGGLVLATIGAQMMLGGLKGFFEIAAPS